MTGRPTTRDSSSQPLDPGSHQPGPGESLAFGDPSYADSSYADSGHLPPGRSSARPGQHSKDRDRRSIVTPARLVLLVALVGSLVFLAWGTLTRGPTQVPLLITGLGILGITLSAIALGGAVVSWRYATQGRGGRAFLAAFLGGMAAIAAFACFTGAAIFTLLWRAA